MARLFVSDPDNRRRLVAVGSPDHTLRGFFVEEGDQKVTISVEWGTSGTPTGTPNVMCFTARLWPGGALLSNVVRPWRRGGDWHACWNETRRQVRDVSASISGTRRTNGPARQATERRTQRTSPPPRRRSASPPSSALVVAS